MEGGAADLCRAQLNAEIERLQASQEDGFETRIALLVEEMGRLLGQETRYEGLKARYAGSELGLIAYPLGAKNASLSLVQKPYESGDTLGHTLWDGALTLARYVEENASRMEKKRIVELGSGIGLTGLVAATSGTPAAVYLTDLEHVLSVARDNVERNRHLLQCPCHVAALEWGNTVQADALLSEKVDFVLAADVVSRLYSSKLLLETISYLAPSYALVSFERHDVDSPEEFLERARAMFKVEELESPLMKEKMVLVQLSPL